MQSIKVPDKNGKIADVVLGFDSLDGYLADPSPIQRSSARSLDVMPTALVVGNSR